MSFLAEALEEFVGDKSERRDQGPQPPSVQWPWVARWDDEARSWIFVNEETGERTWERPVMEEVSEGFGRQENRVERTWDNGVQDVEGLPEDAARWGGEAVGAAEDLPEDAARWTGEAVGAIESVPDRLEGDFDRAEDRVEYDVDRVEDAPEEAAEWMGDEVGKVERFGDGVEESYDQGRDEERYDY
ncbi:hypothetical protein BD289DRAFT_422266 [Coniella lustricola]|uniref:WW domain-containing protein n=1 Tax=Coniella lustricola TaxID=2025994 RepID=A0A2T3AKP3_9PEZI|nr:hypothetical protein BD289DRAFT_422266 [Coniella lustricola]